MAILRPSLFASDSPSEAESGLDPRLRLPPRFLKPRATIPCALNGLSRVPKTTSLAGHVRTAIGARRREAIRRISTLDPGRPCPVKAPWIALSVQPGSAGVFPAPLALISPSALLDGFLGIHAIHEVDRRATVL